MSGRGAGMQTGIAISDEAKSALMAFRSGREGELIPAGTSARTSAELLEAGYVGTGSGLTRAGSVERRRLLDRLMDELF